MERRNRYNKKGVMLDQEAIVVIVTIIFIGLILFFSFKYTNSGKKDFEKIAPNLTYQYPTMFVHSFLMKKIDAKDVEVLKLDKTQTYQIKDLLAMKKNTEVDNVVLKYKKEYVSYNSQTIEDYEDFSGETIDESSLLYSRYFNKNLPLLEKSIENKNYFFYLKDEEGRFVVVYFKRPSSSEEDYPDSCPDLSNCVEGYS